MITLTFTLDRETKGTVRYQEVDAQGLPTHPDVMTIGTLYIRKTVLGITRPKQIRVILDTGNNLKDL